MTSLTIQFPPTNFPAGGGTVAFPPVSISADLIAELLGFTSAATLKTAIGAGSAPATAATTSTTSANAYPLAVPATPNGAAVSVGTGPNAVQLSLGNDPGGTSNAFAVLWTPPGGTQTAIAQPFTVTSFSGENEGGQQVLTIHGTFPAGSTFELVSEGAGLNGLFCELSLDLVPYWSNGDYINSRGTGAASYGTQMFNSNGNNIVWLPQSAIPAQPVAAPPPALTSVAGATINGTAATGTLAALIGEIPAADTLDLPAGTVTGTALIPVACTIQGAGSGKTILDCTGLQPIQNKAVLIPNVPGITISGLTVHGAAIPASLGNNAAGIRDGQAGAGFTLNDVEAYNCQNGLLTFASDCGVNYGNFHDNGAGDGLTHEMYFGGSPTTTVTVANTKAATGVKSATAPGSTHAAKSRSGTTKFFTSDFTGGAADGGAVSGSVIDIPDGGLFTMTGGSITLRPGAANTLFLGYGMESAKNAATGLAVVLAGVVFDGGGAAGIIQNGTANPTATIDVTGCTYKGTAGPPAISGFASVVGVIAAT